LIPGSTGPWFDIADKHLKHNHDGISVDQFFRIQIEQNSPQKRAVLVYAHPVKDKLKVLFIMPRYIRRVDHIIMEDSVWHGTTAIALTIKW
jgi:hypothetical protein